MGSSLFLEDCDATFEVDDPLGQPISVCRTVDHEFQYSVIP